MSFASNCAFVNPEMAVPKFMPTEEESSQKIEEHKKQRILFNQRLAQMVSYYKLVELQCEYYGMSSFYYDREHKRMYEVQNTGTTPVFKPSTDQHILKLNKLL